MKPDQILDVPGAACALLTPLIKQALLEMPSGALLQVNSDDPAAREGVPAWSRLTGNSLLKTENIDNRKTTFIIQKK
jgi:TusA-related sulfurtransferase